MNRNSGIVLLHKFLNSYAAKEKLEIVSGAAPPPFRIFSRGNFPALPAGRLAAAGGEMRSD
ncbi:MAG: hypothetical protein A3D39_01980 [Candidatus Buchananbacteria bacterium RIFCSPHIGHO2_02_FULL_39_17]|nr:MAG: hypothetical protein A3D39_01980 [Candidatus Buchananbacteria bacterium RIFCSPHIGHO2_02_FULL_39_17]